MGRRRCVITAITVGLSFAVGWRVYREFRPGGATWTPPLWSLDTAIDGGSYVAPDGRTVRVVFHDFGAAQSGNYWTWIVADNELTGKRVIAEGYSSPDVREGREPFPLPMEQGIADGQVHERPIRRKKDRKADPFLSVRCATRRKRAAITSVPSHILGIGPVWHGDRSRIGCTARS